MPNRDWNRQESAKRGEQRAASETRRELMLQAGPKKLQLQLRHMAHKPTACQLNFQAKLPLRFPFVQKIIKQKKAQKKKRSEAANVTRERHVLWTKFSNSIRELARRRGALYLGQNSVYGRGLMASFGTSRRPPPASLSGLLDAQCNVCACVIGECVCT